MLVMSNVTQMVLIIVRLMATAAVAVMVRMSIGMCCVICSVAAPAGRLVVRAGQVPRGGPPGGGVQQADDVEEAHLGERPGHGRTRNDRAHATGDNSPICRLTQAPGPAKVAARLHPIRHVPSLGLRSGVGRDQRCF